MRFARLAFLTAGIYGLLVLLPYYFMEGRGGRDLPPGITHPEYFYGFLGVGASWQVTFLIISRDPAQFRPLMIPSVLEKATYGCAVIALFAAGRLSGQGLAFGLIDLAFGILFVVAYVRTAAGISPAGRST